MRRSIPASADLLRSEGEQEQRACVCNAGQQRLCKQHRERRKGVAYLADETELHNKTRDQDATPHQFRIRRYGWLGGQ